MPSKSQKKGFTAIELIISLAIIGIVFAVIFGSMGNGCSRHSVFHPEPGVVCVQDMWNGRLACSPTGK